MKVQLMITGDSATGQVSVTGPIDDLRLIYWLLGEVRRLCEARAAKREAASDGSGIVVVKGLKEV